MRTLLDVVLLDVVVIASLTAQAEGSPVLLLPASTRSAGLGGAGAALVGDAGAVFANPAGIATIRHLSVEGSYERYLAGATLSAAALALRLGRLNWGAGAAALDYGAGSAADLLGVSSLVFRTGVIALGGSGKYFRQEVGGSSAHAWAGDAGVAIAVFDIMALGASVQNIGGGRSGAPPPRLPPMLWTLAPSAMMSKTATATPASPAQASALEPPTSWRRYLADPPSAITPVRNTSEETPSRSVAVPAP